MNSDAANRGRPTAYLADHLGPLLIPNLERLVGAPIFYAPWWRKVPAAVTAVIGWGFKGKGLQAAARARRLGLPYVAVEDGFLRSLYLGDRDGPLSVVVDSVGIYYDARAPSLLEQQIAQPPSASQRLRADRIVTHWRAGRLSKYNHAREVAPPVSAPWVLVVDQTAGDESIQYGLAQASSFHRMLEAALDEHPTSRVVLKVHPDVIAGRKRGHFAALTPGQSGRVMLLATDAHAPALLECAASVYVVTSQMGFEALLWKKPVRAFGMPFYAGWGLTMDELAAPGRRRVAEPTTLEGLVHAALVDYPRYLDPETFERCEPERLMDWMALQRRTRQRFPACVQALEFSQWKQPIARAFFSGSDVTQIDRTSPVAADAAVAVWGRPPDDAGIPTVAALVHVEDGFLRSVGLGANWIAPLSWVMDRSGMYYDATRPSDLETLLQTQVFDAALLARARALRERLVASGVTKYNIGHGGWQRPAGLRQTVVLVPGQVESDASIRYGAPGVRGNMALLQAVRRACPQAYVIYKPHPDVLARKRPWGQGEQGAANHCDELVTDVPIDLLLKAVDEVHVLTSLAGFEALLRGKRVVCHGLPFYAGWGLTQDMHAAPRRTRRLSVDELAAGALILYPTYMSRTTGAFTTPERVLLELENGGSVKPPPSPAIVRLLRRLKRLRERRRRSAMVAAAPPAQV